MFKTPAAFLLVLLVLAVGAYWFKNNLVIRAILAVAIIVLLALGIWGRF